MNTCDGCYKRPGELVFQHGMPPLELRPGEPPQPWVFRGYRCRWCRAAWNRELKRRKSRSKPLTVIRWLPDAEVLREEGRVMDRGWIATRSPSHETHDCS